VSARPATAPGRRFDRRIGRRIGRLYCVLAGGCDLATGLGLIAAPRTVLSLMGIAGAEGDASVYLRFLGAFVAGVGASYLYPLLLAAFGAPDRPGRLPAVIEVTALVRTGVALFVAGAVTAGALATPWISVAGTDAALAALQLWLLGRGAFGASTGSGGPP